MNKAADFLAVCGDFGVLVIVGRVALGQPVAEAEDFDAYLGIARSNVRALVERARSFGLTVERWEHESGLEPGKTFTGLSIKDKSEGGKLRLKCGPMSWAGAQAADYAAARLRGVTYETMKRDRERNERLGMTKEQAKEEVYRQAKIRITDHLLADNSLMLADYANGAGPNPAFQKGGG